METICPEDEYNTQGPSIWLTGFAVTLTIISIICLTAIVYLLMQEGRRYWPFNPIAVRQLGTDKEKLLVNSLTFPNPASMPDSVLLNNTAISRKRQDSTTDKKKVRFSKS